MTVYAIALSEKVAPNDRMFMKTVDEVADVIRWALPKREIGAVVVLTIYADIESAAPKADDGRCARCGNHSSNHLMVGHPFRYTTTAN